MNARLGLRLGAVVEPVGVCGGEREEGEGGGGGDVEGIDTVGQGDPGPVVGGGHGGFFEAWTFCPEQERNFGSGGQAGDNRRQQIG